eukprot:SAG11_NODE_27097_length_337_cov_0.550420_1_plen_73_part_10
MRASRRLLSLLTVTGLWEAAAHAVYFTQSSGCNSVEKLEAGVMIMQNYINSTSDKNTNSDKMLYEIFIQNLPS